MRTRRFISLSVMLIAILALNHVGGWAFSIRNHDLLTGAVLSGLRAHVNGIERGFSPRAIAQIKFFNAMADEVLLGQAAVFRPALHFTNEKLEEGSLMLEERRLAVIAFASGKPPAFWPFPASLWPRMPWLARWELGFALHAIQDFYSHSTYLEMQSGNVREFPALGWQTFWSDPAAAPCPGNPDVVSVTDSLSSAYIDLTFDGPLPTFCATPPGKCRHGDYGTLEPAIRGCVGINKDLSLIDVLMEPYPLAFVSPLHDKAMTLAQRTSHSFVKGILDELAGDDLALLALLDAGSEVAFVIDNSTSMTSYIREVQTQVRAAALTPPIWREAPDRWILTVFNDPDTGTPRIFSTVQELLSAVDAISPMGGGTDCPEPSNAAVLKTLDVLAPGSQLFLFTDAEARDGNLEAQITARTREKAISFEPIKFDDTCAAGIGASYTRMTDATGGSLFRLAPGDYTKSATIMTAKQTGTTGKMLSHVVPLSASTPALRQLHVDSATRRLLVEVTSAGSVTAELRDPRGVPVVNGQPGVSVASIRGGTVMLATQPMPGAWSLQVSGIGSATISASTDSPSRLESLAPVQRSTDMHGGYEPMRAGIIAGTSQLFSAALSGDVVSPTFEVEDAAGTFLFTAERVALRSVDSPSTVLLRLTIPSVSFRVRMRAASSDGSVILRTNPTLFGPASVSVVPVGEVWRNVVVGATEDLQFTVTNHASLPALLDIVATAPAGVTGRFAPTSLSLGPGASGVVTLTVTVASTQPSSSQLTVGISARQRSNAAVFGGVTVQLVLDRLRMAGRVADAVDGGVEAVQLRLSGPVTSMTQTDSDGRFVFDHLPAGAYTVTATKEGLVMSPASLQVVLADSNRQDLAYSAASAGQALGFRRYFAEGATSAVFNTVFALFNPTTRASRVRLSFLRDGGGAVISDQSLLPGASVRVSPREFAGMAEAEFSTLIESSEPVIASRHMTWDDRGYGSHNESSIAEPRSTWYLAEGVTSSDFDLFYLLQNPWSAPVTVEIDYLRPAPAQELRKPYVIPPFSRRTVWVNQEGSGLASAEVSAVVRTAESQPIVVERAVYVRGSRTFEGGHASAGIAAPALEWFLAEGATGSYFDTFVLIVNPDERAATLRMDYLLGDGSSVTKEHTVPGRSRYTVWVDEEDAALADVAVSTVVQSTNRVPVVVERAMWWRSYGQRWTEGHNSPGSTRFGSKWAVADVRSGGASNDETYVLIANTSYFPTQIVAHLTSEDGRTSKREFQIAARSRFNISVGAHFPELAGTRGSMVIDDPSGLSSLVVECSIYSDAGVERWAAGANLVATVLR